MRQWLSFSLRTPSLLFGWYTKQYAKRIYKSNTASRGDVAKRAGTNGARWHNVACKGDEDATQVLDCAGLRSPVVQDPPRQWNVRASFYNITNQKNWIAEAGLQGNDLITAALPFRYQVGGSYGF
jgi:hypothetical protein